MSVEEKIEGPPSVWLFTVLAAGSSLTPLVNRALGDPISAKMHSMLAVAAVAFPLASLLYLFGRPSPREKVAVILTFAFGGGTLLWVDWSRVSVHVVVLVAALFLIPTLVKLVAPA